MNNSAGVIKTNYNTELNSYDKKSLVSIPTIIYLVFFINLMCYLFSDIPLVITFLIRMLTGSIGIIYCIYRKGLSNTFNVLCFMFIYSAFGILANMYNNNADLIELCWPIAFMGLGILLINYPPNIFLAKQFFLLFYTLCVIHYVVHGSLDTSTLRNVNNMNVILLLIYSMLVTSYVRYNHGDFSITMLVISLISLFIVLISVGRTSGGRSGVLVFSFITFCNVLYFIYSFMLRKKVIFILSCVVVFILIGIYFLYEINIPDGIINERLLYLHSRGFSSLRTTIWKDYIEVTNQCIANIFWGTDYMNKTSLLSIYSYNLHNSFLMLHAKYTLFMLIAVILLVIRRLYLFIDRKEVIFFYMFLALLIRMNFDYTNFNGPLDTLLIFYLFVPLGTRKMARKH